MEQRVTSLEEELKVLKSQIKAVLLDIKDYMATAGNGQAYPSLPAASAGHSGSGPAEGHAGSGPITVSNYDGPAPAAGGGYHGQEAHVEGPREEVVHVAPHKTSMGVIGPALSQGNGDDQVLDLLTVSVLAQWLARAMPAVGREQLGKLVEIYDITGNLQPRLKDTMLLLADLCAGDNQEEGPTAAEAVPAAVSVQLLIELDGLLRYRNGAVESVVMSMLLDKGEGTKRDGHG